MMLNHHLATFIQVADNGSFIQAGEKMYVSATAVTKQINLLEQHLNVKLFHRSAQGLTLTQAGQLVYDETKKLIKRTDAILQKARELENKQEHVIRVGVSLMNTSKILLEEWEKAAALYPAIKLQIIPYEDSYEAFIEIVENFGNRIDVIACPNRSPLWENKCNSFYLRDLPLCVSVPTGHRLASRVSISPNDLEGERIIMINRNIFPEMDPARDDLEANCPGIQIQGIDSYSYSVFNDAVASCSLLLTAECWTNVHPLLHQIPVDWPYTIPYGLLYATEPAKEVLQFIMAIGKLK